MNEQIRELADEAGMTKILNEHASEYGSGVFENTLYPELEKFAELIVRECIGCCEQVISDPVPESVDTWLNGGTQCMAEIREHFGVE